MARSSVLRLLAVCAVLIGLALLPAATHAASNCKDGVEAYYLANGEDYRGIVNVTETGLSCQKWSVQTPNPHDIALDPARGVGDHNYCRNPNGLERPGCFTTEPGVYQYCNVGDVCTEYPVAKATVLFSPPSGAKFAQDGSHNYVSLSCFPRPCNIYYTLGAESVASTSSQLYAQPVLLPASTTVKAYAVFQSAAPMRVQAAYTVVPTTTAAPSNPLFFIPSDTVVYDQPILVQLQGVTPYDTVLMYWDNDFMNPTLYTGSFRLEKSTSIYAIVNGTYDVSASYTLNLTAPPLDVYPASGRYVGGVSVLVHDPQPPSKYYMYVNGSHEYDELTDLLFPWTTVGTTTLDIRALHVHGLESQQTVTYEVVAAIPPTVSPDPTIVYNRPVNVTCASPINAPLPVSVYRDAAMQTSVAEGVASVLLRTPGTFTVTCCYTDDLGETHTTTTSMQLVAVPMQRPSFAPECGTKLPAIPLSLQAQLNLSLLLPGAEASSWSVYGSASGGATIPMIARASDDDGVFLYDLFPGAATTEPTKVRVSMTARSTDPLESDGPAATCSYSLYPLGSAATPFFSARPACATPLEPVDAGCITSLQVELASCLHFYSTELLSMTPVGPFALMQMTQLSTAIRPDMYFRMGWCLAALQQQGVVSELHNETSSAITLATSWHVATPSRMAPQVFTGMPVTVHVVGFHAGAGDYHMVRSDYSCEDVGVAPEAVLSGSPYALGEPAKDDSSAYITFRFVMAGSYKLCAYIGDALYTVPFSAAPSGNVSEATTPSAASYVEVVPQPLPLVSSIPAADCGGLVPPAMEHTALSVAMAAFPSGAFSSISYSRDNSGWASAALPVDAATQLTGAVTLAVGPLSAETRPVQVLDTTLGVTTGAARTCVFFVSAANPPIVTSGVTYLFYTVNTTAVPAGSTGVMLLLQGTFQPSELIVIDVYAAPTGSSSMQLLRRVTARASAGTAYSVALPDAVLGLTAGPQSAPFVVHATLDGRQVTAAPSIVALSPLSLAMTNCSNCGSGLCYQGACLCKHKTTKAMHVCGDGDYSSDSDSSADMSTARPNTTTTTTTTTAAPDGDIKRASVKERLAFLLVYLALLAGIAGYIFISIRRGGARHAAAVPAEEITVESA